MADGNMTIKEVKTAKKSLENAILLLMQDFEEETGVYTGYISLERKHDDRDVAAPERPEKKGRIDKIQVSMDLDLIY